MKEWFFFHEIEILTRLKELGNIGSSFKLKRIRKVKPFFGDLKDTKEKIKTVDPL